MRFVGAAHPLHRAGLAAAAKHPGVDPTLGGFFGISMDGVDNQPRAGAAETEFPTRNQR